MNITLTPFGRLVIRAIGVFVVVVLLGSACVAAYHTIASTFTRVRSQSAATASRTVIREKSDDFENPAPTMAIAAPQSTLQSRSLSYPSPPITNNEFAPSPFSPHVTNNPPHEKHEDHHAAASRPAPKPHSDPHAAHKQPKNDKKDNKDKGSSSGGKPNQPKPNK